MLPHVQVNDLRQSRRLEMIHSHTGDKPQRLPVFQREFKSRRKSRSRRGNEADRRRVVAKRRRRRVAKAEVFFAPKSASSRWRLPFLNTPCGMSDELYR